MSVTFATDSAIEEIMDIQRIVEAWQDARDDIDNLTEEVKQLRQDIEMLKGRGPVAGRVPRQEEHQPEDDSDFPQVDYSYGNWDQDLKSLRAKVRAKYPNPEPERWRVAKKAGKRVPVYVQRWGTGKGCRAIVPKGDSQYFLIGEVEELLGPGRTNG